MWPRVWNILHQKKEFTNNLVISRKGLENQFKREFKTQQPLDIEGVLNSSSTDADFKKYFLRLLYLKAIWNTQIKTIFCFFAADNSPRILHVILCKFNYLQF